jgi:toxin ParE1/3/4
LPVFSDLPARGHVSPELLELGISEYRELHYKPYRIICRLMGTRVIACCVADGRHDRQSLLLRWLMR